MDVTSFVHFIRPDDMSPPTPSPEAEDLVSYLNEAWTPYHAVLASCKRLLDAGFKEISERDSWDSLAPGGRYFFTRNMSAVCAFAVGGKHKPGDGFVIIGAHTDSPCPRLKPKTKSANNGFLQLRVQNYGGGLWYTWFDRDLGVAGRVLVKRGSSTTSHELVKIDRPIMRISSLAIHLDRSLNDGFKVNFQQHMAPIISDEVDKQLGVGDVKPGTDELNTGTQDNKRVKTSAEEKHCPVLLELLAGELNCEVSDILDFELQLCDTQRSAIGGAKNEYVFSGRLDNLQSCHASLCALIKASTYTSLANETHTRMMVHYDHEEVGSDSAQGAGSSMTDDALRRITRSLARNSKGDGDLEEISRRNSFLVSADMAHAVHPNYSDRHEPGHKPKFGNGVVIKHNANQRYATDAITGWLFRELGEKVGVPVQEFVVRSDLGCGSTIGPTLSTNTGIRTVDVGPPQLSMHSVREMCSSKDVAHSINHYQSVFENFSTLDKTLIVDGKIGYLCRPV